MTSLELYYGAELLRYEKERERIWEALNSISPRRVPIRWEDGTVAAEVRYGLEEEGRDVELHDLMMAVVAVREDEKVLTENPEHFKYIEGLEVGTY